MNVPYFLALIFRLKCSQTNSKFEKQFKELNELFLGKDQNNGLAAARSYVQQKAV